MSTSRAQPVSPARPIIAAAARGGSATSEGPFVINLSSSTTPVALSQPQDPELKRFNFFVSRRLEDGRERFRLHMGYFETLQDAEEWLGVVREVYPGAWAGEAPGKRLRARQEEQARASATPPPSPAARGPSGVNAAAPANTNAVKPPAASGARPPSAAAHAAPAVPAAPTTRPPTAKPLAAPGAKQQPARPQPPTIYPAKTASPGAQGTANVSSGGERSAVSAQTKARALAQPVTGRSSVARTATAVPPSPLSLSNVREVLASLDETGATQQLPAVSKRSAQSAEPHAGLSDSQVLKILEARRVDGGRAPDDSSISVLKPDDTGTRRELRVAIAANSAISFAVQLQWSVQPVELTKVPPLAIFSAYTLYTVEGSREGRRWYGLRLGFFSDAISAKQVAQYVRSEFASVAVVPVGQQERTRASATDKGGKVKSGVAASQVRDKLPVGPEFKLIDEPRAPPAAPPAAQPDAKPPAQADATPTQKRPPKSGSRVRAREKRSPQTLEETLEILGADQLEIDDGRGEVLNDTGVRHLKMEVRKDSPFTKLLDRLSERARKAR